MNQRLFVSWCQEQYEALQMDPTTDKFEDAHYPVSQKRGDRTIPLHHLDHAIQGLWQSEEQGEMCFWAADTLAALNAPNYFPPNWFDAWDLYERWNKEGARQRQEGCYFWHNPETGERRRAKTRPEGAGWIEGMGPTKPRGTWWHNKETGERKQQQERPDGTGWVKGQSRLENPGWVWWFNPETGKCTQSRNSPGDGWVSGRGPTGQWWFNPGSGQTVMNPVMPEGEGWIEGRGPVSHPKRLIQWNEVDRAVNLRKQGMGYPEIAKELGTSEQTASRMVASAEGEWWHNPVTGEKGLFEGEPPSDQWIEGFGTTSKRLRLAPWEEVLSLRRQGKSYREIGETLGICRKVASAIVNSASVPGVGNFG